MTYGMVFIVSSRAIIISFRRTCYLVEAVEPHTVDWNKKISVIQFGCVSCGREGERWAAAVRAQK